MQDQIGGQSWPSSLSAFETTRSLVCDATYGGKQFAWKDEPSGRLLDPGREAGARGMIVTEQARESRDEQNPAYRFTRRFSISYRRFSFVSPQTLTESGNTDV